jgi:antitoxin VapB
MEEAKLFKNGQSQAVRLPRQYRFRGAAVYIRKLGNTVLLMPKDAPWESMSGSCSKFTDDFMQERRQGTQEREDPFK